MLSLRLPYDLGKWALRLWIAGVAIFIVAGFVGTFIAISGPGGDTDASWAAITVPVMSSILAAPLVLVAPILGIYAIVNRRNVGRAIAALVLGTLTAYPAVLLFLTATSVLFPEPTRFSG